MRRLDAAGAVLATALVACGGVANAPSSQTPQGQPSTGPASIATSSPRVGPQTPAAATPTPLPHVFVIVMENTSLGRALEAPSIERLAAQMVLATNYRAVANPSLPNYLALTSGSTWGIRDNGYHRLPEGGIGAQLTEARVSWRAYMEGLTDAGCMASPYPYALKHNPFAYYGGSCPDNVVPFEALEADLAGKTPNLLWITPGLCHDAHDCPPSIWGPWLEGLVAKIVASPAFREGVLFIVWDEGDGGGDIVPLLVARPGLPPRRSAEAFDHFSLLATIQDLFRLPRLGQAAGAKPLTELLSPR